MVRGAVGALVAVLAAGGMAQLVAAPVRASTPIDLGQLLAPPPASDYVEYSPAPGVIDGQFDAKGWADFVSVLDRTDASSIVPVLKADGFTRGYGRSWYEQGKDVFLQEFVFEFSTFIGAGYWRSGEDSGTRAMKEYGGALAGTSSVPGAWTAKVVTSNSAAYRVGFAKGNAVYELSFDSRATDLTAQVLQQVQVQYDRAPGYTIAGSSSAGTAPFTLDSSAVTVSRYVFIALVVVIVLATVLVLVLVRRRRRMPALTGLQISPDGSQWWDGTVWRDSNLDAPARALRSPDGTHWWDGRMWRPVPPPR